MAKQTGINWQPIFDEHKGEWVALKRNETTIVASGKSAKTVYTQAQNKGVDVPLLFLH